MPPRTRKAVVATQGELPPSDADHKRVEEWLSKNGVDYEYHSSFDISQIDQRASQANQARFEPISGETVERYTVAMGNGDVFPPLVGYRQGTKVILIGGNHRLAAHIANNHSSVPIYLVDRKTKPATITKLTYEDNTRHGHPASKAERLRQAQHLVESSNASYASASNALGLSYKEVEQHMRRVRDAERWRRLGIEKETDALGVAKASRLGQVQSDDAVTELVKIAFAANLTGEEVSNLVVEVNKRRSVKAAEEYLQQYRNSPEVKERISDNASGLSTRRARRGMTALGSIRSAAGLLQHADPDKAKEQITGLNAAELDALQKTLSTTVNLAEEMLVEVRKRIREITK